MVPPFGKGGPRGFGRTQPPNASRHTCPLISTPEASSLAETGNVATAILGDGNARFGTGRQRRITRIKRTPGSSSTTCCERPAGTVESRSWWTTVDALTEDFSLAAGRYKPQIAEPAPEGNPAQFICETLALEREIVTGLEKLLKEIEE